MSGLDFCDPARSYAGPDSPSASVTGSCHDRAGNVASRSFAFNYDSTAPQVSATPARAPNANGWYNASLSVAFAGSDPTSASRVLLRAADLLGP